MSNQKKDKLAKTIGITYGNYETVNKLYDETTFNASQGHGFAAEHANNLSDKLSLKDAKIVGSDNAKNGPDRCVDGINIQTKYCKTASESISSVFEKGEFKYFNSDGTPMQIEVPSDQYDQALQLMEKRIKNGEIKGITDTEDAKTIVRQGDYSYEQAKNIAKAGNIESLKYDAKNGAITGFFAFGISSIISFIVARNNEKDFDESLNIAIKTGLKSGGAAFMVSTLSSQLSKVGLNSALVGGSTAIVNTLGSRTSAAIVNSFRGAGTAIHGAAAKQAAAKLLRGNAITGAVTVLVLSAGDISDIFNGKISGSQLFKNITKTTASVGAGVGGFMAGATAGSVVPVVGTLIGGLLGAFCASCAADKVVGDVLDEFIEDDSIRLVKILEKNFKEQCDNYLLNQREAQESVEILKEKLDARLMKEMYASGNKQKFAENILIPIIENIISKREAILLPNLNDIEEGLKKVFNEIVQTNKLEIN